MKNLKAQVSTEYMMIMGLVLIITIPLVYYAMSESNINVQSNRAEDAVNTLARAADTVYSIGPGTTKYVWINMPGGVQAYSTADRTVSIDLYIFGGVSQVFAEAKAELAGVIPISSGQHRVKVEMLSSGYVQFGDADDTTAPIVIWTSPRGTINYNGIILRATTNEYSVCRYDEDDVDYSVMSEPFVGSALTHERDIGILENGSYKYYVRCEDPRGNTMDTSAIINFTIVPVLPGVGEEPYEPYPPIVSLIRPENGYKDDDGAILFEYNVTDDSSILFCDLIIDSAKDQVDFNITKNITQNFTKTGIEYGNHTWNVNCTDAHGNRNSSVIWEFSSNATLDVDVPIVNLEKPANNTVNNFYLARFSYNVSDVTSSISYCNLNMIGVLDAGGAVYWIIKDSPIEEDTTESITLPLFKGNYTWNVSCVDDSYSANEGYSKTWNIRINATAGEDAFLNSCTGYCGVLYYSSGDCVQNCGGSCSGTCEAGGDTYCPGEPTPKCCCYG